MKTDSGLHPRFESALIVEDDPAMAWTLSQAVSEAGYVPMPVPNLEQAREAILEDDPDVVLLDLGLGGALGSDLLEHLSREPEPPVVVIVSGFPLADLVADRFGVELVRKPFELDALFDALERARARHSRPRRAG